MTRAVTICGAREADAEVAGGDNVRFMAAEQRGGKTRSSRVAKFRVRQQGYKGSMEFVEELVQAFSALRIGSGN